MVPGNDDVWMVEKLAPGLVIVRITQSEIIADTDVRLFDRLWEDLLSHVGDGGVVVLNFRDVTFILSNFLSSLVRAYKKFEQRGVKLVGCHLSESLQELFVGRKQPLDYMLNYSDTEELAVAKAERMLKSRLHGSAGNDLALS